MGNTAQNDNKRNSYRCAVDPSHRQAELRAGDEWLPVELLDESAGGFGIRANKPMEVSVGDVVQLRMGDECFEARVMNIVEQASDGDHEEKPTYRLGLKRLGEIYADDSQEQISWFATIRKPKRHRPPSKTGTFLGAALVFAFLVGAAPIIIIYVLDSPGIKGIGISTKSVAESSGTAVSKDENLEPLDSMPDVEIPDENGDFSNRKVSANPFPKLQFPGLKPSSMQNTVNHKGNADFMLFFDRAKLKGKMGQWSHAFLAAISDLSQKLGLTDSQNKKVDSLLQQTDRKIALLDEPNPDNTPQKVESEKFSILQTAYAKLMDIFTAPQRIEWHKLVQNWDKETEDATTERENSDDQVNP